jgi:IS30 family transposase
MRNKLTREERILLSKWKKLGYSIRLIAVNLGRAPSTISNELRRNKTAYESGEPFWVRGGAADELFRRRRSAASRKMRLKSRVIRHFVELHLQEARWSPEIIAGRLSILGYKISAEAIYQFINVERPDLKGCLLIAGKSRRRRRTGKRARRLKQPAASKRSIEFLPEAARERRKIGHFELDAVVGKRGGAVIQNKTCRHSRRVFFDIAPNLEAKPYSDVLIKRLSRDVPSIHRHSILQDNGVEHACHQQVDAALGTLSFFCHPYCASERGTVENRNGVLRRFFPKGSHFDDIPVEYVEWVEDQINNTPMRVLKFKTPNEVWAQSL